MALFIVSCNASKKSIKRDKIETDYLLLNQLLDNAVKLHQDKNISFKESNNNEFIISIIKELKKHDFESNKSKLDSLKKDIGIYNDKKFEDIFNQNEYDFLIYQNENSTWDYNKINDTKIHKYKKGVFIEKQITIQISKPIYTIDKKYAIIFVGKNTSSYMLIYKKEGQAWVECRLFYPRLG